MSPSGDSFVGEFTSSRVINIPRNILDHKVATAAARQGAHFRDQSLVEVRTKKYPETRLTEMTN